MKSAFYLPAGLVLLVSPVVAPAQTNLALNRPSVASSLETAELAPSRAVDGSTTTRWSSAFSDPQWISVDLGALYAISRVTLQWEAAFARAYAVQLSSDGQSWSDAYATSGGGDGGLDDLAVTGQARFVRVYGTARATPYGYSLFEIGVFGTPATAPPPTGTNLASGRPATSSSIESADLGPDRAVDGSTTTRWSSAFSDPQWLQVDLGARYDVQRVALRWEAAFARAYQIQLSDDGQSWQDVYRSGAADGGLDDLTGLSGVGRFLRVLGTARATPYGYSLYELEAYGTPAAGGPAVSESDLAVHSISRLPRTPYPSYRGSVESRSFTYSCCYDQSLASGAETLKRWPDPGEPVRYAAAIRNQGDSEAAYGYRWLYDGAVVETGTTATLAAGQTTYANLVTTWADGDHTVALELLGADGAPLSDPHAFNDRKEVRTNALTVTYYLWPDFVAYMREHENALGTRSAEDWLNLQVDGLNALFASSVHPSQPDGVRPRVALDRIVLMNDGDPDPAPSDNHAPSPCPTDACYGLGAPGDLWQGRIATSDQGPYARTHLNELARQLGLIELWAMDLQPAEVLIDEHPKVELFSDTGAGPVAAALFDGTSTRWLSADEAGAKFFAVRFDAPRTLSGSSIVLQDETDWELWAGPDMDSVLARAAPAQKVGGRRHSTGEDPRQDDVHFSVAAPVWLLRVDRLAGDRRVRIQRWRLLDDTGAEVDVRGLLLQGDRVAGTERMPARFWESVYLNSTTGYDLMSTQYPYRLSEFHVAALNRDANWMGRGLPLRRGYVGAYTADAVPRETTLLVRDGSGQPVGAADIDIYQEQDSLVPNVAKYRGTTDGSGRFTIPHATTLEYAQYLHGRSSLTTANPFSTVYSANPDFSGRNAVLVIAVRRGGDSVYRFLDLPQIATERARGNTEEGVFPIDVP